MLFIFALVMCALNVNGAKEGDVCIQDGVSGVCTDVRKCTTQDFTNRKIPQLCTFVDDNPVVCCLDDAGVSTTGPVKTKRSATPEDKACEPIAPALTANKTGQKAWDKCIEYQQLVHPCQKTEQSDKLTRQNRCHHDIEELVVGDNTAKKLEYPHAVLLGYGNDSKSLRWLCGGALISDRYILTVAHCATSREFGPVTYAALHVLDRTKIDPQHQYKIKKIITHPEFKPPKAYHNIGLLELENPLSLDSSTVPACLNTGASEEEIQKAVSTSWNTIGSTSVETTVLQKLHLTKFSAKECSELFPANRKGGYNDTTQACYGSRTPHNDICTDDGGSPLMLKSKLHCMYSIIGLAAYGRGCVTLGPGVYTRVEPYVPWIESVVWP